MYCLRLVSCASNAARFSGLSILDCSFGFLYRLFIMPLNLLPYKLRLYSHKPDYLAFLLVSKARTDKPNIFRPCTYIQHARPLHGRIIPVISKRFENWCYFLYRGNAQQKGYTRNKSDQNGAWTFQSA
jgi:hypothetical protein